MKKYFYLLLLGILFLSFNSQAGWQRIWDEPVDMVVVQHNQVDLTTEVFATEKSSGDIYRYQDTVNDWAKVGGPGKTFISTGQNLVGISPAGNEVWMYTGQGQSWQIVGDEFEAIYGGGGKLYGTEVNTRKIQEYEGGHGSSSEWDWRRIGDGGAYDPGTTEPKFAVAANENGQTNLCRIDFSSPGIYEYVTATPSGQWDNINLPGSVAPCELLGGGNYMYACDYSGGIWRYNWNSRSVECEGGSEGTTCTVSREPWEKIGQFEARPKMVAINVVSHGGGNPGIYVLSADGKEVFKYAGNGEWDNVPIAEGVTLSAIYAGGGRVFAQTNTGMLFEKVS